MSNEHPLNICSLFTSSIYQAKIKCKGGDSYFYHNRIYRPLEIETNFFFHYFISEIPNFSYMRFFRKCSILRWSIPLRGFMIKIAATWNVTTKRNHPHIFLNDFNNVCEISRTHWTKNKVFHLVFFQ